MYIAHLDNGNSLEFANKEEMMRFFGVDTMEDCIAKAGGWKDADALIASMPEIFRGTTREEAIASFPDVWALKGLIEEV